MPELYIPTPQDNITPAMNLYKLMQQKKEYELDLQKQGTLQDYHKQLGQQGRMQNIITLAKDQPEAATQLFNNDPELVQANKGQQVKFLPEQSDGDWNVFETGDTLSKINKKTGEVENTGLPRKEDTEKTDHYTLKNTRTGEIKSVRLSPGESVPSGWEVTYAPSVTIIPTSEGYEAIRAERGTGLTTVTTQPTGKGKALPASELKTGREFNTLKDTIGRIHENYSDDYVGPIAGRYGQLQEKWVDIPEKQAFMYADVRDLQDSLLRARSGAQINEQEYKRLVNFLPDPKLPPSQFKVRLRRFEVELESMLKNRAEELRKGGYGSQTESIEPSASQPKSKFTIIGVE